jgi:GntR family transcriptional regulator, sialic acid-inducible nan operon repressor
VQPLSIERRKLYQQVAEHIEQQILSGALKPGERLPAERDLQTRFGVGRPAIREALISLQKAGLVEISNGSPARVAMPTAEGIMSGILPAVRQMLSTEEGQHHFQRARMFLETGLARQAARDATPEDHVRLTGALAANRTAIGDRAEFIRTDIAFHYVLAEITRNPVFLALYEAMSSWLKHQRVVTLTIQGQEDIAFAAHRKIHRAILAGDSDKAEEAMRAHLSQLEVAYWEHQSGTEAAGKQ